jgi:hypothetical protein
MNLFTMLSDCFIFCIADSSDLILGLGIGLPLFLIILSILIIIFVYCLRRRRENDGDSRDSYTDAYVNISFIYLHSIFVLI